LKPITVELINEYYVSQYLERRILEDNNHGSVICCRQNMKESVGNPWLMLACKNGATSASVDGMQFYGKTFRETRIAEGLLADRLGANMPENRLFLLCRKNHLTWPLGIIIKVFCCDLLARSSSGNIN